MLVALDTTAVLSDPMCTGIAWRVLARAIQRWGVRVAITEVSLLESVSGYQRRISESHVGLDRWYEKHGGPLGLAELVTDLRSNMDATAERYAERLTRTLEEIGVAVVAIPDVPHKTLVERATARQKPCNQNGDGYRDTLNWLALLQLLKSGETDQVVWVTNNSGDFANDDLSGLHEQLDSELEQEGLAGKITWFATLNDAVLHIAAQVSTAVEDVRDVHQQLRSETVREYIDQTVLPSLVSREMDPRLCALPPATASAVLTATSPVTHLDWETRAAVTDDEAVVEFTATVDAAMALQFDAPPVVPPVVEVGSFDWLNEERTQASYIKPVVVRGLLTIDRWDKPQSVDVTSVEAPLNDPGRRAWRSPELAKFMDVLIKNWPPVNLPKIPAEALAPLSRPLIPPETIKAWQQSLSRSLPPELFKPVVPPSAFEGLRRLMASPQWSEILRRLREEGGSAADSAAESGGASDRPPPNDIDQGGPPDPIPGDKGED